MTPPQPLYRRYPWLSAGAAMVLLKLWLVAGQPLVASGRSGHDDRLYLHLTNHLVNGEWLGSYSQFTLMKGPMYSLWIAATFFLGLPLPLAQHLLYLAGCVLIVRALQTCFEAPWQSFTLFTLMWWNPMTYELPVLGRVLRQNLYTPTSLLLFAALIALHTRLDGTRRVRIAWGLLLGISSATLWLTREEGIWAFPSTILLVATAAGMAWRERKTLRPIIAPLTAATSSCMILVLTVCTLNYHYYGWFGTVEFRAPEFISAYGALQRVLPEHEMRYVPVTREAREKIYAVSPAFAELKPYLEGDGGRNWAAASVSVTGLPGEAREIGGGWFMWALRDGVAAAGHAKNAPDCLAFYQTLADEVNRACDDGRLKAAPRRDSLVPRWGPGHWTRLNRELPLYVKSFLFFQDFDPHPIASSGEAWMLQLFRDLCRWPVSFSPEAPDLERPMQNHVDGWRIAALDVIGRTLCWINSATALTGLAAWCWTAVTVVRTRKANYAFAVSTAALMACGAVVSINLLVHIMSFYNRSPGAFAQAYPLLLLGTALPLFELVNAWQTRRVSTTVAS